MPVTAKFRIGLHDGMLTHLRAGEICADEGVVAIAVHARTAQQHYAGDARWDAIAELKAHVTTIPVLGNGDIWEAVDAVAMMRATGCDGVVVGRGCLGRPWLFGDLLEVLAGRPAPAPRPLGVAAAVMVDHAAALVAHHGDESLAMRARSASTPRGTSPATRWAVRRAGASPRCPRWPSSTTSSPRSTRRSTRRRRAASGSAAATPTARSRSRCPDGFLDDLDALEHDLAVPDDADVHGPVRGLTAAAPD